MAAKGTLTPEAREYINTVVATIKGGFMDYHARHKLTQAFERMNCRCVPLRNQVADLTAQAEAVSKKYDDRIKKLQAQKAEARKPFTTQIDELNVKIRELDRKDHPISDQLFNDMKTWIRLWVIEQLKAGTTLPTDVQELRVAYMTAVAGGWRPAAPKEAFVA